MAATTKISYKDVINFFDEITPDMAELVIGIINDNLEKRAARKVKVSAILKKARAAKGKGDRGNSQSSVKADPAVQAEVAAGIPVHRGPGRPRRVEDSQEQRQHEQSQVNSQLSQAAAE